MESGVTYQVSNVVNGVFSPDISPTEKPPAVVGFVAEGYRIETLPIDLAQAPLACPRGSSGTAQRGRSRAYPSETTSGFAIQSGAHLFPRPGVAALGAASHFSPWSLRTELRSSVSRPATSSAFTAWSADSRFSQDAPTPPECSRDIATSACGTESTSTLVAVCIPAYGLRIGGKNQTYDEEAWQTGISTDLPLLRDVARSATMYLAYNFTYWRNTSKVPIPSPDDISLRLPEVGRYGTLEFDAGLRRHPSLSVFRRTRARWFDLGECFGGASGARFPVFGVQPACRGVAEHRDSVAIALPSQHTLMLAYEGGISGGDLKRRGVFYAGSFPSRRLLARSTARGASRSTEAAWLWRRERPTAISITS